MNNGSVLIIDDEQGVRDIFKYALEPEGWRVSVAENGTEAIEITGKETFDIILLDVHMPGINALDALKGIKKNNSGAKIYIFSAGDYDIEENNPYKKNSDYFWIEKPFQLEEIYSLFGIDKKRRNE